jgi:hypothetical protein
MIIIVVVGIYASGTMKRGFGVHHAGLIKRRASLL